MKSYASDDIRNVCLVAHGGVGKTSLLEAMTFTSKGSNRLGKTDDGTSIYDTRDDELERKMTIGIKTTYVEWKNKKINLIDTPGFIEFLGEAKAALRVVESAVILVDAVDGIQVGTEHVAKSVQQESLPTLFYVNKIDRENADFDQVLNSLVDYFGTSVAPIQIPMGSGGQFKGVVDLVNMEAYEYEKGGSGVGSKTEIPEDLKPHAEELRNKLMESVAESDEDLMNKFFDAGELTNEEMVNGLLKGVSEGNLFPVLCGSAGENMGTDLALNALMNLCPAASSRKDITDAKGEQVVLGGSEPALAYIYKTLADEHMGMISFLRVFSGSLASGNEVLNTSTGTPERLGSLYAMRGASRSEITSVAAGDICATLKLKNSHTGNTFATKARSATLPPIEFPNPLVEKAIRPKAKGDEEKIGTGMARLHEEDPVFHYGFNQDIGQTIISGMGDVHIDVLVKALQKRYKVGTELGVPRIPYRETIKSRGDAKFRHKKQSGGAGQFAEVWLRVEPKTRGDGVEFKNSLVGQNVDRVYVPSVEKGVNAACREGAVAGYPIVDVMVDFYDGKMHPVDSNDVSFQIAGKGAFKEAIVSSKPCLLEPVYTIEVFVPEDYTGDIMGDLSSRRGKIGGMERDGKSQKINARVPLVELSNYMQNLRSMTQGRGYYAREFSHYEEVPGDMAPKLIDKLKQQKEGAA